MGRKALPPDKKKKHVNTKVSPWVLDKMEEEGMKKGPEFERCVIKIHGWKEPK